MKLIGWMGLIVLATSMFAPNVALHVSAQTDLNWFCVYDVDSSFPENDPVCPWEFTDNVPTRTIDGGGDYLNYTGTNFATYDHYIRNDDDFDPSVGIMFETYVAVFRKSGCTTLGAYCAEYGAGFNDGSGTAIALRVRLQNTGVGSWNTMISLSVRSNAVLTLSYPAGTYHTIRWTVLDTLVTYIIDGVQQGQYNIAWVGAPGPCFGNCFDIAVGSSGAGHDGVAMIDYWAYNKTSGISPKDDPDPTPLPIVIRLRYQGLNSSMRSTDLDYVSVYDVADSDSASPAALQQVYILGSRYIVERDDLFLPKTDANRFWINDTKSTSSTSDDTILLNTTDTYTYINLKSLAALTNGENITIQKPSGTAIRTDRSSTVRYDTTVVWSNIDPSEKRWVALVSYANDLTRDWTNFWTFVPFEQGKVASVSTVRIFDVANNQDLVRGTNYAMDSSGVNFGITSIASGQSRSFVVEFREFTEGTQIIEPSCTVISSPTSATFESVNLLSVRVNCVNQNPFIYSGRVVMSFSTLNNIVNIDTLKITDTIGTRYTNIVPITNTVISVYGVTMNSFTSREFILYFLFTDPQPTRNWLRENLWTVFMLGLTLIFAGITLAIWPHKRDDKQRKMTGILVIVIGGLIASITLAAGLALG